MGEALAGCADELHRGDSKPGADQVYLAKAERMRAGERPIEVTRLKISEAGRRSLGPLA